MKQSPLPEEKIEKGVYITPESIQKIIELTKEDPKYSLEVMKIIKRIESEYPELTCKSENGGIVILTDKAASEYNAAEFARGISKAYRRHRKQLTVNSSEFNEDEKGVHERRVETMGKMVQAAIDVLKRKSPRPIPIVRSIKNMLGA